ncbi:MAG: hypothetical protein ACFFDY_07950, partial [Candidatus Thorarchaeota archaeon]
TLPEMIDVECYPENPKTSVLSTFDIQARDNKSGIESTYIFLSKNNFSDIKYYGLSNNLEENKDLFQIPTEKLTPGEYSYCIVLRDYANNTNVIFNSDFTFLIPQTIIDYLIPISTVMIIAVGGITVYIIYNGLRKYMQFLDNN